MMSLLFALISTMAFASDPCEREFLFDGPAYNCTLNGPSGSQTACVETGYHKSVRDRGIEVYTNEAEGTQGYIFMIFNRPNYTKCAVNVLGPCIDERVKVKGNYTSAYKYKSPDAFTNLNEETRIKFDSETGTGSVEVKTYKRMKEESATVVSFTLENCRAIKN